MWEHIRTKIMGLQTIISVFWKTAYGQIITEQSGKTGS